MLMARKYDLPPAEEYLAQIDLDRVAHEILALRPGEQELTVSDYEDAQTAVLAAADTWLARDIADMTITGVEQPFSTLYHVPGQEPQSVRGIKDLVGWAQGHVAPLKQHLVDNDIVGPVRLIVDWKTTANTLDVKWRERLIDSWQWRLYADNERLDSTIVVNYRGISRPKYDLEKANTPDGKCDTRDVFIVVPPTNALEVQGCVEGVSRQYRALIESGLQVWTRKMPSSCGAYGRTCTFFDDCRDYDAIPKYSVAARELSYSSIDRFMLCPELYRRMEKTEQGDGSESTRFGVAVHAGLAELYRQVKEKFL
jgi:hypothetical protein